MRSIAGFRLFAVGVLLIFAAQAARAQLVNENLLTELPAGYKVGFQDKKNNMLITELVPTNESVANWTEMVTVQIFYGLKSTPAQFKDRIASGWLGACRGGQYQQGSSDPENGYATLLWRLSCPLNPATGKPEMTWFKAVQGNDSLYIVQKAFKFTPNDAQVARWTRYLGNVKVCDSRLPDRRCPQAK